MRDHFMQKNTIKKHEMTGKTEEGSSPLFSFFGGHWLLGYHSESISVLIHKHTIEKLCSPFNLLFVLYESCVMVANLDLFNSVCLAQATQHCLPSR